MTPAIRSNFSRLDHPSALTFVEGEGGGGRAVRQAALLVSVHDGVGELGLIADTSA